MSKKALIAALNFIVVFGMATGWTRPVSAQEEPVKIGIPLPLSGAFQEFGMMMKNSFEMAQETVNQSGGIQGRPLQIVFADDRGDVDSAKSAFAELMKGSRPVMLVGGYASDPTYHLARLAEKEGIPHRSQGRWPCCRQRGHYMQAP